MPTSAQIALMLGEFSFTEFEVPEEIDSFGATLSMVAHPFTGGKTSVQTFGAFAKRKITWSGHFFEEPNVPIRGRIEKLRQIVYDEQQVSLTMGDFQRNVMVKEVDFKPRLQFWVPYTIELFAVDDPTAKSGNSTSASSASNSSGGSTPTSSNSTNGPTMGDFGVSATQLANNAGNAALAASQTSTSLPQTKLQTFQNSLKQALLSAGGNPSNIASAGLSAALNGALGELAPLAAVGSTPLQIAYAATTSDQLQELQNMLAPVPGTILAPLINPDLQQLALIAYGNADLWTKIANANNVLTPNPVGQFILSIPNL